MIINTVVQRGNNLHKEFKGIENEFRIDSRIACDLA